MGLRLRLPSLPIYRHTNRLVPMVLFVMSISLLNSTKDVGFIHQRRMPTQTIPHHRRHINSLIPIHPKAAIRAQIAILLHIIIPLSICISVCSSSYTHRSASFHQPIQRSRQFHRLRGIFMLEFLEGYHSAFFIGLFFHVLTLVRVLGRPCMCHGAELLPKIILRCGFSEGLVYRDSKFHRMCGLSRRTFVAHERSSVPRGRSCIIVWIMVIIASCVIVFTLFSFGFFNGRWLVLAVTEGRSHSR